jgi:polysaccharide biosynthesis/export protein
MKKSKFLLFNLSFLFLSILTLDSCISKKKLVYFQAMDTTATRLIANPQPEYHLQPRDIISIRIKTLDEKTAEYFNIFPNNQFQQINPAGLYINGYSIDTEGNISLPEIGTVHVANLTLTEAQKKIQEDLNKYISNASLLVKLVSFKVTVLGEVRSPGYFYVYNERATVLEALGLAGDLTDYGQRDNVTLIRQVEGGSKAVLINLKDPNLIASPYYYVMPNDVLYVQPLKAKLDRGNLGTLNVVSLVFGLISTTVLLLNYLK